MTENKSEEHQAVQYISPAVFRFRIDDDFYKDGCVIYKDGLLEIEHGGMGRGAKLSRWFEGMDELDKLKAESERVKEAYREAIEAAKVGLSYMVPGEHQIVYGTDLKTVKNVIAKSVEILGDRK